MNEKRKVVLLIATHCPPKVLRLTLGSWLATYDGSYEADVYIGLHNNYSHYHSGLDDIKSLEGPCRLVFVDEMDWTCGGDIMRSMFRYSEMHVRSIMAMTARAFRDSPDLTHVAILDHDLIFESDFVGWAVRRGVDMVCSLFKDNSKDSVVRTTLGATWDFAPKPSVWHMVVSRKVMEKVVEKPELAMPGFDTRAYDTMARAYEAVRDDPGLKLEVVPEVMMSIMVRHVWSMSMNYGQRQGGDYGQKVASLEAEHDRRFPNGIGVLLKKLGRSV